MSERTMPGFRQVTADEWADYLIKFNCHGTEKTRLTLDHVRSEDGFHLATVSYSQPEKTYWINEAKPPELNQ